MALLPVNVDYTAKDKRALDLRLQGLIRSVFPDWTDFNKANFGNIQLESFAYVGDVLTFYQDNQAREMYWPTVTQRANAIRLGRMINFVLTSAAASTGTVRFSVPTAAAVAIPIPVGTRVRTPDRTTLRYRTTVAGQIEVGATFADVAVEQATLVSNEVTPSSAAPNQRVSTNQSPVIDNTYAVTADDGTYLQVTSFLDADPLTGLSINASSRVFVGLSDQFERGLLLFGNGKTGKIPEGVITASYKIGGGVAGNVDAGQIVILEDTLLDALGGTAQVTVTNQSATSGGVNRMSVAEARAKGPASLRVQNRSVTKDDFEVGAELVPGVARAGMATSNEDSSIQENRGVLSVVAKGEALASGRIAPATPSAALLAAVTTKVTVTNPPTLTFEVSVQAAPLFAINVSTRIYLDAGVVAATVGTAVKEAIKDFFAAQLADGTNNPGIDFGANIKQADGTVISEIAWSDIFNAINDTAGVRRVDEGTQGLLLNLLRKSVTLNPRDFPIVGTISVVDADTGASL